MVAVGIGLLAVDRGSLDDAARALEIAAALCGAQTPVIPREAELRAALAVDVKGLAPAPTAGTVLDGDGAAAPAGFRSCAGRPKS